MVDYCRKKNISLIIGCDANAQHLGWSSKDINDRGETLFTYLVRSELVVANIGNEPTFRNAIRREVLDLTLANSGAQHFIEHWKVSDKPSLSDHAIIKFRIR